MAVFIVFWFLGIAVEVTGCGLPWRTRECSLITQDYAVVASHKVDKCLSVGGMLFDGTPTDTAKVNGQARYQFLQPAKGTTWNFTKGLSVGTSRFDFNVLARIARSAQAGQRGKYRVVVVSKGGTYNMYNFSPKGQVKDNGRTLVIFNTSDPVVLTKTPDGKGFGPSVLAPFSQVTVSSNVGYIDGCLIVKQYIGYGAGGTKLRMHGNCYKGPITCSGPTTKGAQSRSAKGGRLAWWKGLLIGFASVLGATIIGGGMAVAVKTSQMQKVSPCVPIQSGGTTLAPAGGDPCASAPVKNLLRRWDSNALGEISSTESSPFLKGQEFAATWFVPILTFVVLVSLFSALAGISKIHKELKRRRIVAESLDVPLE